MKVDEEVSNRVLGITSDGLDIGSSMIEELWNETNIGKVLCQDPNKDCVPLVMNELTPIARIVDKIFRFNLQQKGSHRDQFTLAMAKTVYLTVAKIKVNWVKYILYFMTTKRTHLGYDSLITYILNYYYFNV